MSVILVTPWRLAPLRLIAPEQRNETAVLIGWQLIHLHRSSNRRLLVRSIDDDADEFRGRAFDAIHGPGRPARLLLFGRSLRHHKKSLARRISSNSAARSKNSVRNLMAWVPPP